MFVHTVFFWFKPGTRDAAREQLLRDCATYLSKIPSVRQLYSGPPAGTPRDVVDNSYAAGLTVLFDDAAGHDVYAVHPLHLEFIERNKAHWERVQIYDFVA